MVFLASVGGTAGRFSGALDLVAGGGLGGGHGCVEFGLQLGDAGFGGEVWAFVEEMTDPLEHFEFVDGAEFHAEIRDG